ncbi:MAG: hypothetical protein A3J76_04145 [Candidatus Moranbacteria bacterium RBG_13_45_13]|nr:MAG: hypothetical protein A3J76_04145 [Candidatus Moranbacteria bacterium RBG_13_45_13]
MRCPRTGGFGARATFLFSKRYSPFASAFAFQRSSKPEKFSFPFEGEGGEIFEKMKENFSGV